MSPRAGRDQCSPGPLCLSLCRPPPSPPLPLPVPLRPLSETPPPSLPKTSWFIADGTPADLSDDAEEPDPDAGGVSPSAVPGGRAMRGPGKPGQPSRMADGVQYPARIDATLQFLPEGFAPARTAREALTGVPPAAVSALPPVLPGLRLCAYAGAGAGAGACSMPCTVFFVCLPLS